MGLSKFGLYCLFVGLLVLVACSPQRMPPAPTSMPDESVPNEVNTPSLVPTASPDVTTPEPETLLGPAYPAENQVETGKGVLRGSVEIAESEVVILENPLRVELKLTGNLPTPCHTIAWEVQPVSRGAIQVEVFTKVDPEVICVQVLEPFDERIELIRLLPGDYTVWVNGEHVGEFQLDSRAGYP